MMSDTSFEWSDASMLIEYGFSLVPVTYTVYSFVTPSTSAASVTFSVFSLCFTAPVSTSIRPRLSFSYHVSAPILGRSILSPVTSCPSSIEYDFNNISGVISPSAITLQISLRSSAVSYTRKSSITADKYASPS